METTRPRDRYMTNLLRNSVRHPFDLTLQRKHHYIRHEGLYGWVQYENVFIGGNSIAIRNMDCLENVDNYVFRKMLCRQISTS